MELNNLPKLKNAKGKYRRIGRGYGSRAGGHTVGRGTKGQKSRTGGKIRAGFSGGQTPLYKALPQYRGFKARENKPTSINLESINSKFEEGDVVTLKTLREAGLLDDAEKSVKILAYGEITKKLTFNDIPMSQAAREKIEKAGGSVAK
jgi:large subunit ribosomal protein L15